MHVSSPCRSGKWNEKYKKRLEMQVSSPEVMKKRKKGKNQSPRRVSGSGVVKKKKKREPGPETHLGPWWW